MKDERLKIKANFSNLKFFIYHSYSERIKIILDSQSKVIWLTKVLFSGWN